MRLRRGLGRIYRLGFTASSTVLSMKSLFKNAGVVLPADLDRKSGVWPLSRRLVHRNCRPADQWKSHKKDLPELDIMCPLPCALSQSRRRVVSASPEQSRREGRRKAIRIATNLPILIILEREVDHGGHEDGDIVGVIELDEIAINESDRHSGRRGRSPMRHHTAEETKAWRRVVSREGLLGRRLRPVLTRSNNRY